MKALLPVFCRPVGYLVLLIALFILPVLYIQGICYFIKNVRSC